MNSVIKERKPFSYKWLAWVSVVIIIMNVYHTKLLSLFVPFLTTAVNSVLLVFATVLLILYFVLEKHLKFENIYFTVIDICLILAVVVIVATSKGKTDNPKYIIRFIILTIFAILAKYDESIIKIVFYTLLAAGLLHVVLTLFLNYNENIYLQYVLPTFDSTTRTKLYYWFTVNHYAVGVTDHFSTNGMLISMACICSYLLLYLNGKKRKILYAIVFLVSVVTLFMTGKRAVLLFVFFTIAMTYLLCNRSSPLSKINIALSGVFGLILIVYVAYQNIESVSASIDRFTQLFSSDDVSNGRFALYTIAWSYFLSAPVFGIGWKQFSKRVVVYYHQDTYVRDTHNIFLQLLCETGIVGFAVYMLLFVISMYYTVDLLKKSNSGVLNISDTDRFGLVFSFAFQLLFLSYATSGNPLYDIETLYLYVFSIGFTSAVHFRYEKKPYLKDRFQKYKFSKYIK